MREQLIMSFACSACGRGLTLRTDEEQEVDNTQDSGRLGDPTGAKVRYVTPIQINPCQHCIEAKTKPAEKLAQAIKELTQ